MKKDIQKSTQKTVPSFDQFDPKTTLDKVEQKKVKGGDGIIDPETGIIIHEDVADL